MTGSRTLAGLVMLMGVCLVWSSVRAQDPPAPVCTQTYTWGMTPWSATSESYQLPDSNAAHVFSPPVPAEVIWRLRTVSLSTSDATMREYFIEHLVNVPGGNHYHAIARGMAAGTPALFVPSADLMASIWLPGERIAGRANGTPAGLGLLLMWSGWSYPEACLSQVMRPVSRPAPSAPSAPSGVRIVRALQAGEAR